MTLKFQKHNKGPLRVWEPVEPGEKYVGGLDSGEGLGQEDSVLDLYKRSTGFQVCQYITNQQDPEEFTLNCIDILNYYNQAFVVPEKNNSSGGNVVLVLKNNYIKKQIYKKKVEDRVKHVKRMEYGWLTTPKTRGRLIFSLKAAIKGGYMTIRSQYTLDQLKTFVRITPTRMEHAHGEKDDGVFAPALAWQGFKDVMPKKIQREVEKEVGGITMGEFVKILRKHEKKSKEYIIGSNNIPDELSIIV